jgi:hypothetical protein
MNFPLKITLCLVLLSPAASRRSAAEEPPKYGPKAVPLIRDHRYFRGSAAPDFWRLMPFYVPQSNGFSCSLASMAMVFNAAARGAGSPEQNITQESLLEGAFPLRELVSAKGRRGRHGLTLEELGTAVGQTARSLGVRVLVTAHSLENKTPEELRKILRSNEKNPDDFLLAHFVQDDLTGAAGGPYAHISPIGAYDSRTRRVLILDVDRLWYSPYWVSDEDLLASINHVTNSHGRGGLLQVRFDPGVEAPEHPREIQKLFAHMPGR